jgi:predicted HicB family RNase H-like nuclease
METMVYEDFIDSVYFSSHDMTFHGKVEGVNDLITFEGDSVKKLNQAFKEAVEDYLELCKELNKAPLKSFKGSFNIRINPKLHAAAYRKALQEGISLNELVEQSIEQYILL